MKTMDHLPGIKKILELEKDSQKAEEFEKFCKAIAHDLRNPIATISMEAQSLKVFADKLRSYFKSSDQKSVSDTMDSIDSISENILLATKVLERFADDLT